MATELTYGFDETLEVLGVVVERTPMCSCHAVVVCGIDVFAPLVLAEQFDALTAE